MTDRRTGRASVGYSAKRAVGGAFDAASLASEIAASALSQKPAVIVSTLKTSAQFEFSAGVSEADLVVLDQVVAAHMGGTAPLSLTKDKKLAAIKLKTAALVANGSFEYPLGSGKLFGMSEVSQLNITGAFNSRNASSFAYPIVFFTKNDLDSVSLEDAAAVESFHVAAVTAIRAIRDGGAALKAQVVAATTLENVNAIVDNR